MIKQMKMKNNLFLLVISILSINFSFAEKEFQPVSIEQVIAEKGDTVILSVVFNVSDNWMVYDSIIGDGGPIPLTFDLSTLSNLSLIKVIKPAHLHKKYDDIFEVDMLYFKENVTYEFILLKTNTAEAYSFLGSFEYMCCNLTSGVCLPPRIVDINSNK